MQFGCLIPFMVKPFALLSQILLTQHFLFFCSTVPSLSNSMSQWPWVRKKEETLQQWTGIQIYRIIMPTILSAPLRQSPIKPPLYFWQSPGFCNRFFTFIRVLPPQIVCNSCFSYLPIVIPIAHFRFWHYLMITDQ